MVLPIVLDLMEVFVRLMKELECKQQLNRTEKSKDTRVPTQILVKMAQCVPENEFV